MVLEDPCIINNLLHSIGYRSKIQRFEDLLPLITVTMLKMSIDYYEDCFGRARKNVVLSLNGLSDCFVQKTKKFCNEILYKSCLAKFSQ